MKQNRHQMHKKKPVHSIYYYEAKRERCVSISRYMFWSESYGMPK